MGFDRGGPRRTRGCARGDIVILTHEAIDSLIGQGKAVAGSRLDLGRSVIGIAVRKGAGKPDISSPDALKRALLAAKSVAMRRTGVSRIYFPTLLERLGIREQMKGKRVMPEGEVAIGEVVARGGAELGVAQISEFVPFAGIEIVGPLPAPLQKSTIWSAGVLASAEDQKRAQDQVRFISTTSRPLLAAHGLKAP